jgi:hypothetical protein
MVAIHAPVLADNNIQLSVAPCISLFTPVPHSPPDQDIQLSLSILFQLLLSFLCIQLFNHDYFGSLHPPTNTS